MNEPRLALDDEQYEAMRKANERMATALAREFYLIYRRFETALRVGWNAPYYDPDALVDTPPLNPYI